jgi:oligopeptide transport system ATP-binding protein
MSLLEVKDLHTSFFTAAGEVKAVNGVSFNLEKGEVLGVVGESGSGKSVTAYSIMQILTNPGKIVSGSIKLNGQELVEIVGAKISLFAIFKYKILKTVYKLFSKKRLVALENKFGSIKTQHHSNVMNTIRGKKISMIFQDPMTSLNPVYTVGNQLKEGIILHTQRNQEEAQARALEILTMVGVNDPLKRLDQYPHELSGGMRQRVMIAMAIACEPDILIADEPTTALDVTIQAQILDIIQNLQKELGMATILITHDLGVVAGLCNNIIVMYGGKVAEKGTTDQIFYNPKHEYTKGLLKSIPSNVDNKGRLIPIGGSPIDLLNMPSGCAFCPRCDKALKVCLNQTLNEFEIEEGHFTSCWMAIKEEIEKGNIKLTPEEGATKDE